jgi:hypothetical protein
MSKRSIYANESKARYGGTSHAVAHIASPVGSNRPRTDDPGRHRRGHERVQKGLD